MDNTMLNQTQTEQMPQNGAPMGGKPEHKGGKGIFIAILIIVVAALLGYWYLNAPKQVPEVQNVQQPAGTRATTDASAEVSAAEDGLDNMYFEGVSDGL
ncbi:MAG TPA: hypothetical protein VLB02_01190 [Candidatus Paceibacterota bacterium]|nr:hypothetical protein [Candidatus Paceibacterota bacterium]